MKTSHTRLAFFIAPLWVPVIVTAMLGFIGLYAGVMAYAVMALFGLPAFLWLRARGWTSIWMALATGLLSALAVWFAMVSFVVQGYWGARDDLLSSLARSALLPGTMGALVGVTFWLIARPDRPKSQADVS